METNKVQVWDEKISIPTYQTSTPEKYPVFLENRAYQGSSGKVYPFPVIEKINDSKEDVLYHAVFLENKYLKVMILPELGGRIHRATDKTNQYDFIYYNHVIKPALVGLAGPWISGGIEFNWPQHHRPSTFLPVEWSFLENEDGSCSVCISEIDKMHGTKGMAYFTLYPDTSYIEVRGQLYNRTETAQTFLWWANPAVPVNDTTFSVFPPDVNAVMDHGKRAVSSFPIATGEYYKYDYSEGIDISMYKNVKVPTSFMAAHSDYDFIGNYDSSIESGLLHIADHHISPGKKQWTWGCEDFGIAWDRNLTDEDGPYIELMTGVYTDNQPDFTWLMPFEEKTFTQYFMPYKRVGRVKNATKDAVIGLDLYDRLARISAYSTKSFPSAMLKLTLDEATIFETTLDISPEKPFCIEIADNNQDFEGAILSLFDSGRNLLVSYVHKTPENKPLPQPAEALPSPDLLKSCEELYLAASHLEQYRHATYDPCDYYLEGLKRDSSDLRLNTGYGILLYKSGQFEESIPYFKRAVDKSIWKNPNPYSGEPYYHLGLAYLALNKNDFAFDAFYKATWSANTQSNSFFWLACITSKQHLYHQALAFIEKSLIGNWHNMKARNLKLALLRILNIENSEFLEESLQIDPMDMGCQYESSKKNNSFNTWLALMHDELNLFLEYSYDYLQFGFFEDAISILKLCHVSHSMLSYYLGYAYQLMGNTNDSMLHYQEAENLSSTICFPNKIMEILILSDAIKNNPDCSFACCCLGNLFYDKKQYNKASQLWSQSITLKQDSPMVYRNLAIHCFNKEKNHTKALEFIRHAFSLDHNSPRLLLEYDQLLEKTGSTPTERLKLLNAYIPLVLERDALLIEYITLLNSTKQYKKAYQLLSEHVFHPWEGGEGKVSTQYKESLFGLASQKIIQEDFHGAIDLILKTLVYPDTLGEGKLPNARDNIAHYYLGKLYLKIGNSALSREYYVNATQGTQHPESVIYYNDQPADQILYQGFAFKELGNTKQANKCFYQLMTFGKQHIFDTISYDYFAVSLPEMNVFNRDIQQEHRNYCQLLIALGYIGQNKYSDALTLLHSILDRNPNFQFAIKYLDLINQKLF